MIIIVLSSIFEGLVGRWTWTLILPFAFPVASSSEQARGLSSSCVILIAICPQKDSFSGLGRIGSSSLSLKSDCSRFVWRRDDQWIDDEVIGAADSVHRRPTRNWFDRDPKSINHSSFNTRIHSKKNWINLASHLNIHITIDSKSQNHTRNKINLTGTVRQRFFKMQFTGYCFFLVS
jgi:hypothetical protein